MYFLCNVGHAFLLIRFLQAFLSKRRKKRKKQETDPTLDIDTDNDVVAGILFTPLMLYRIIILIADTVHIIHHCTTNIKRTYLISQSK